MAAFILKCPTTHDYSLIMDKFELTLQVDRKYESWIGILGWIKYLNDRHVDSLSLRS